MTILLIIIGILIGIPIIMIFRSEIIRKHTVVYLIKKGKHASIRPQNEIIALSWKLGIVRGNRLTFEFIFNGGCKYDPLLDKERDINKLYGMSFGFDPQYRSIRIGWRHIGNGDIELFTYVHNDGPKETYQSFYTVKCYNKYRIVMTIIPGQCWIELYDSAGGNLLYKGYVKVNTSSDLIKFKLFPYFGGTYTAPQDMMIYINEK